jgi:hypothetical protein
VLQTLVGFLLLILGEVNAYNRQDFSDRAADPKSLLDGALRRGSGEREA